MRFAGGIVVRFVGHCPWILSIVQSSDMKG